MKPIYTKNRTIALLGGSFNPAHAGHLHISEYALKTLKVDEVWWLVSPKNPLKSADSLADYSERFASAMFITKHNRRIFVSNFEKNISTNYTYHSLTQLKKHYHGTNFIWLMGADNLAGFHNWQHWQDILKIFPVLVFDRAPYSFTSLASKTYLRMRRFLLNNKHSVHAQTTPSLRFIHLKRNANSATNLRKTLGIKAFIGHNQKHISGEL
ncbi:MAG: nicotinate (nicotinamide) nucleotide adenylyltransferase [Rickettsiales bacterium]